MKKLVILSLIFVFAGCTQTKYIPVETVRTEYKNSIQRDSIYFLDSVLIREKGDTVFIEKYRYLYRDRFLNDTIFRNDSIPVPYPVKGDTVTVTEYKRGFFWWFGMGCFILIIGFVVGLLAVGLRKR